MSSANRLSSSLVKRDKFGQELRPGNLCIRSRRKPEGLELCVYIGTTRSSNATGQYGRFLTTGGVVSIRHDTVAFVSEQTTGRTIKTDEATKLIRSYYENV